MAENKRMSLSKQEVHFQNKGAAIIAGGTIAMDGTSPTTVDTLVTHGIRVIRAAVTSINTASPLADDIASVSATWSGSTLTLSPQEYTSGSDPTLVASNSTEMVSYIVIGDA